MNEIIPFLIITVGCIFVYRVWLREKKLYELRTEYMEKRIELLKRDLEYPSYDDDEKLLSCPCSVCDNCDSTEFGPVCMVGNSQYTENGECEDFELNE